MAYLEFHDRWSTNLYNKVRSLDYEFLDLCLCIVPKLKKNIW